MTREMSELGLAVLEEEEGTVLRPYRDIVGVWTQGTGHTSAAGAPIVNANSKPWTPEFSRQVLRQDVAKFSRRTNEAMGVAANQQEIDGGTSFDFNTGAINKASWVKLWKDGKWVEAGKSFRSWDKAGGKPVGGLTRRRAREWRIISMGDYSRLGTIANVPSTLSIEDAGSRPDETTKLQADLIALGYLKIEKTTGYFGTTTDAAVRAFQAAHPHLTADGKVGPATRAQIQRNLDLRSKLKTAGASAGASAGAVVGADQVAGQPIDFAGLTPGLVVSLIAAAALAYAAVIGWKYRGEVAQFFNKRKA